MLGELELSMGVPLAGWTLIREAQILSEAVDRLSFSLEGVKVKEGRCEELAYRSQALITVLSPLIGYEKAAKLLNELRGGKKLEEVMLNLGLEKEKVKRMLRKDRLVSPGIPAKE